MRPEEYVLKVASNLLPSASVQVRVSSELGGGVFIGFGLSTEIETNFLPASPFRRNLTVNSYEPMNFLFKESSGERCFSKNFFVRSSSDAIGT